MHLLPAMDLHLEGKVALITGVAPGIGRTCEIDLAREGAFVVSDLEAAHEGGLETVRRVVEDGGVAQWIPCGLGKADQIRSLIEQSRTVAAAEGGDRETPPYPFHMRGLKHGRRYDPYP